MEEKNKISNYQIQFRGQLYVNIPATLIILFSLFILTIYVDLSLNISVIIGGIFAWIYWTYALKNWIKWAAIENNVGHERLYKIGKNGLLLWNRDHLKQVVENKKKPWF
jgi:hypothetical protein